MCRRQGAVLRKAASPSENAAEHFPSAARLRRVAERHQSLVHERSTVRVICLA
eukprot:CAMPEP_0198556606 /NCGR_PEP_ID=MMETSP1462-20131121/87062_1 /TAXON_ID=1333877 /ORGANISM="Brandtodinium nutriculum, Strain RCC3387" /LENGTH=52 /DNA_ID=CAMNT_0044287361 /DNA_START=217 /DNA_END=372 /DNA_ORIENTATION=+